MQLAILPMLLLAAMAPATTSPSTSSRLTFADRSPQSVMVEQCKRFGWTMTEIQKSGAEKDYDITRESFEIFVPDSYDPKDKWGLLVWVSPGDRGSVHRPYAPLFEKHKLIVIGANGAGNPRATWCRTGLALDAAVHAKSLYNIDPDRVYVSGMSGGGRVASEISVAYPDVFTGGIYLCGVNYYRQMETTSQPGRYWPVTYKPIGKMLLQAKRSSHQVLVTGENDMNREQTKAIFDRGMPKDGFKFVTYLEVPGMGHQMPPADWFEKALEAVDARPTPTTSPSPAKKK